MWGSVRRMEIVLFEPEIPPNTGNVARLCAATGVPLHLVGPLGFTLDDRRLKRAGLDYWPRVEMRVWPSFSAWREARAGERGGSAPRCVMFSARGGTSAHRFAFAPDDALVFGPETRGLPPEILALSPHRARIPMLRGARSINLSTAAGIGLHLALATCGIADGAEWEADDDAPAPAPPDAPAS